MKTFENEGMVTAAARFLDRIAFDFANTLPLYESLVAYRDHGHPVGDFLTALLENDLRAACGHADDTNRWLIFSYVSFLYNEMPSQAWGSREKVVAWLARHAARRDEERRKFHEAVANQAVAP